MSETNGLPIGWTIAPLSSALLPQVTRNPKSEKGDFFQYVDIDALDNKRQVISSPKQIAKMEAPSRARMGIHAGDVIFSLVRPYLKNIAVVPESLNAEVASTAYCVLRPASDINGHFLFYQVLQDSFIHSVATYGNSPPSARDEEFLAMRIRIAPTNEQRNIVAKIEELFSDLDAGVAALERIRANLKRYRAAVLKAAVEGQLTQAWRAKHPHTEPATKLLERILAERRRKWEENQLAKFAAAGKTPPKGWREKYIEPAAPDTSALPELPQGWCWARIEQLGQVQLGRQRSPKNRSDKYPTKYIRAANITESGLALDDVLDMDFSPSELETYRLCVGDVVLSEASGSPDQVGKPAVWNGEIENCCFQNTVIRCRPYGLPSGYFLVVFRHYYFNKVFAKIAAGVGINHLSAAKFSTIPFPLAPIAEQEEFTKEVERRLSITAAVDAQVDANLKRAARLRQSILKRAFEGKLVPQDPNDEPAEKLLERIRCARETASGTASGSARETTSGVVRNGKERRRTKKK